MSPFTGPFHEGERDIQTRVGVAEEAAAVGRIIAQAISPAVARFLAAQRLAVAATVDDGGRPWASLLTGGPGFLQAVDETLLRLTAVPPPDDPMHANLRHRAELGLLVIDLLTRQRMRFNGRALQRAEGLFLLVSEVYGNCPKYIQRRRLVAPRPSATGQTQRSRTLLPWHARQIASTDTFFIASVHPEAGADASHRGGEPGFVQVKGDRRLVFPDYPGNNMFNTLGNLAAYGRVGLLFPDFEAGGHLQLTGRATVRLEPEREVEVAIEEVRATRGAGKGWFELVEPWPGNPPVTPAMSPASQEEKEAG